MKTVKQVIIWVLCVVLVSTAVAVHAGGVEAPEQAEQQYRHGMRYYVGESVEQSYVQVFQSFLCAVERGNAEAQYSLGKLYPQGMKAGCARVYQELLK